MNGDMAHRSIKSSISRIVEDIAPRMISSVIASTAGGAAPLAPGNRELMVAPGDRATRHARIGLGSTGASESGRPGRER